MAEFPAIELEAYVKATMLAIVRGVVDAQRDSELGGFIGRVHSGRAEDSGIMKDPMGNTISVVRFDLATTIQDKSGADGTARVKVIGLLDVGGGASMEAASSLVNRLSFSLPVAIPQPASQRAELAAAARRGRAAKQRASITDEAHR